MNIETIEDDAKIWKTAKIIPQEIQELLQKIGAWDHAKTHKITLSEPYKPLVKFLRSKIDYRLNIKKVDASSQVWYIRIDPRPKEPRSPRKVNPTKNKMKSEPKVSANPPSGPAPVA